SVGWATLILWLGRKHAFSTPTTPSLTAISPGTRPNCRPWPASRRTPGALSTAGSGRPSVPAGSPRLKGSSRFCGGAARRLGVAPGAGLFVDDQPAYCAGAAAVGIGAVQIIRDELDGKVPTGGAAVVRSLPEVEAMFWELPVSSLGADHGVEQVGQRPALAQ